MLKTRTITSHLHSLNTEQTMACEIGNPGPCVGQTHTYDEVNLFLKGTLAI
jgi:hypothetical protein